MLLALTCTAGRLGRAVQADGAAHAVAGGHDGAGDAGGGGYARL